MIQAECEVTVGDDATLGLARAVEDLMTGYGEILARDLGGKLGVYKVRIEAEDEWRLAMLYRDFASEVQSWQAEVSDPIIDNHARPGHYEPVSEVKLKRNAARARVARTAG